MYFECIESNATNLTQSSGLYLKRNTRRQVSGLVVLKHTAVYSSSLCTVVFQARFQLNIIFMKHFENFVQCLSAQSRNHLGTKEEEEGRVSENEGKFKGLASAPLRKQSTGVKCVHSIILDQTSWAYKSC